MFSLLKFETKITCQTYGHFSAYQCITDLYAFKMVSESFFFMAQDHNLYV